MTTYHFPKDTLPAELVEIQKIKGTYDSPCISVCNYAGENEQCQTCSMLKKEKTLRKEWDQAMKDIIAQNVIDRLKIWPQLFL